MKKSFSLTLAAASAIVLSACVAYPSAGTQQADTPPRIVIKNDSKVWDNPGLFGPVPAELAAKARATCATLDTKDIKYEAKGYHAKAQDVNGNPFPNGGYYCLPKQ